MDKKVALVLSGGGSKGAFQVGAEMYLRQEKGYKWDVIAGVSVGALNGTMLAMQEFKKLKELWETITDDQVFTGKMNFWALVRMAFGAKSALGNKPLWNILQQIYDPSKIKGTLMVGTVSILTGEYERYLTKDDGFLEAVLASTAIPLVWSPVKVPSNKGYPEKDEMVDGGVRHVSPVGDILGYDPTEVVIINCSPMASPLPEKPIKNALDIGKYTMDLAMNEIFRTDIEQFLRINRLVKQAKDNGVILVNNEGKEFREFKHLLIEPEEPLGDSLKFFPQESKRRINLGWEAAKKASP